MTDENDDVLGPIDFLTIEFTGGKLAGETATALENLIDNGTIRLYDLAVVRKAADGSFTVADGTDGADLDGFAAFAGARSGLLGDDDFRLAAETMDADTVAVIFVYENRWAENFVSAARREGGQMIASARIPAQDILDALDALDPA